MALFIHAPRESSKTNETTEVSNLACTGAALRERREELGLSLHDLASQLNMGDEQLSALEAGDRSNLPEAVFIRASVRRIANKLGLDPDPLIAKLRDLDQSESSLASKRQVDQEPRLNNQGSRPAATANKQQRWGWLRLASGLAAVSAAIAAGWSWSQTANLVPPQQQQKLSNSVAKPVASKTPSFEETSPKTVTIFTSEPSWIAIRNQGGELLFEGMVDQEKTLTTDQALEIYAGRPDLVRVNSGSGQQGPLGPIDQVRWYSITAEQSPTAPPL